MNKKKKSPQHSTAFIFIMTLLVSLIILGIVAYIILDAIVFKKAETGDVKIKESFYTPDIKDNETILIIGENEGTLEYTVLMYYNALHSRILFTPIPVNTFSQVNTRKATLEDFYKKDDPKNLCRAVENLFDISVQKYIKLTPSLLNTIVKNTSNLSFPLVCDMDYKNPKTNEVTQFSKDAKNSFNGSDLRKIILYPNYPDGIFYNMYYTGFIARNLVNNFVTTSDEIISSLDNIYNDVILKSTTNIEEYDFYSKKLSFLYMIDKNKEPAIFMLPKGDINEKNYFIVSDEYKNTVNEYICNE